MQTIVLVMQRKFVAEEIMRKAQANSGAKIIHVRNYDKALESIISNNAGVALIETPQSGEYDVSRCLDICANLREKAPWCKLFLCCPDEDRHCIERVIAAQKNMQIDDFLFYDTTTDYLISKLFAQ
jgi:hypothetical protein